MPVLSTLSPGGPLKSAASPSLLPKAAAVSCNIRDEAACEAAVRFALETFGRLDLLVNNGGGQYVSGAADIAAKGFRAVVDTNLTGTFLMTKAAYNLAMKNGGGGSIVNIIVDMKNGCVAIERGRVWHTSVQYHCHLTPYTPQASL
jgi:NAD(P)-dependent dehydrogenase (short-subunit alcohol dehydrogenase family)